MSASKSYPVKEILGCQVITDEGECLGLVVDVLPSGGNDIFVVHQGLREIMLPALKSVVNGIQVAQRRITVKLPQGLREVYENS